IVKLIKSAVVDKTAETQGDYYIDETCSGCGECLKKCPQKCIDMSAVPYVILQEHCLRCGNCQEVCPCKAVHRR
ncbi:MAG: 4Fe-4S binding protein, partial [Blautia sp.]|uniref:4Fe-4S binding protein n=1 Tax=Blautia sp. TaxID=1955243 RepID=UPI003995DA9D